MKKFIYFVLSTLLIASSCDPDNKDIFNDQYVKVKAEFSNMNRIINLGDTLKINLTLPDIVSNGSINTPVNSLQKANFYLQINKIDTTLNRAILVSSSSYWTSKGNLVPLFFYEVSTANKPFEVLINFKPQEKGIYYLEVVPQAGDLKINNSYSARLFVDFNVVNRHLDLVSNFVGATWLNAVNQNISAGFGAYAFRVN